MSASSQSLKAHLAGEVTTVCHCWQVTRRDGVVLGFTDCDSPVEFGGVTHEPDSGFSSSRHQQATGFSVGGAEVEGALVSGRIDPADIHAGLYDGARVETWMVNWADPSMRRLLRVASVARLTLADGAFVAELESLSAGLDRVAARLYRRSCDAGVGDGRCKADLTAAPFRLAGSVAALEAPNGFAAAGLASVPAGWFSGGLLHWQQGLLEGKAERVAIHQLRDGEAVFRLERPDLAGISPGDLFVVTAGCDKRFATCRDKFGNGGNFRGFPHLPGNDAAYGYVAPDLPLDGKPIVP